MSADGTAVGVGDPAFAALHPVIGEWVEEITEELSGDAHGSRVYEVEHKAYDGFIPFTDGGWRGDIHDGLRSERIPNKFKHYVESDDADAHTEFRAKHDISEDVDIWAEDFPLTEERDEFFSEWEMNDEGSTWFTYVKVYYYGPNNWRGADAPSLYFAVTINDDFEYGRESISWLKKEVDHTIWTQTVELTEWPKTTEAVTELLAKFTEEIKQAWRDC